MHWTGHPHRLASVVRIDGQVFRILGRGPPYMAMPALPQTGVEVLPTRTIANFEGQGVRLKLTFMTPTLPDDLMIYSRPVTYITWTAQASDGAPHRVEVYFDAAAEITVDDPKQSVALNQEAIGDLAVVKLGSIGQEVLGRSGDDLRIDWGHLYVAAPGTEAPRDLISPRTSLRAVMAEFARAGTLPASDFAASAAGKADALVAAFALSLGRVGPQPVSRWLILAYDDGVSIQYFGQNLRPYWRRRGDDAEALLKKSAAEYAALSGRCHAFDHELMADLRRAGGEKYAQLCALAYRQCAAGTKLACDRNGQPLLFSKENTSNGCIATVDVIYPMSPMFLFLSPSLAKAMLVPALDYAASPRWKFPFAPHDLGRYPLANGQVYGGGERTEVNQMPVEESGNMIIMLAALAQVEGNAAFAGKYWPLLVKWAAYLKAKGFDPEFQLCTDDFAGHLAHNVNLSAKAIAALGAFGRLAELRGDAGLAREYGDLAKGYAARWVAEADDGGHYRLAFDQSGTWSQKYNLIWDRMLGLNLFPAAALRKEADFYPTQMNRYGLPLDNRKTWVELPWSFWTAALTGKRADFGTLFDPIYDYVQATPSRVPLRGFLLD